MLDFDYIKSTLNSIIDQYIYPRQLSYDTPMAGDISQEFYPFMDSISVVKFYVHTLGSGSITLNIIKADNGETIKSASFIPSLGWNEVSVNKQVVSKSKYKLHLPASTHLIGYSNISYGNDCYINDTKVSGNIAFSVGSKNFVFNYNPLTDINKLHSFPIIVTEITNRPSILQRWIDPKRIEQQITFTATVYSKYYDEIDLICKRIDRALFKNRTSIDKVFLVSPSNIGQIVRISDNVFAKSLNFNIRMFTSDIGD